MTFNSKLSLNILVPSFSLTICAGVVQAACVTGDCSAMGYTKAESNCTGDIIRCPFDTSKVFCKNKPSCTVNNCAGFTLAKCPDNAQCSSCTKTNADCSTNGTSYKITSCDAGYVQNGNTCESSPSPCENVTCEAGLNCQFGCKTYKSTQDGCCSVCSECKPNPCASVTCPTNKTCPYGCASYTEATSCCSKVCNSCNPSPEESPSEDVDPSGCNRSCTPTNRKKDIPCNGGGACTYYEHTETDNCGCEYTWSDCYCASDH